MLRSEFDYTLPPELIAQHPLQRRTGGRMLCVEADRLVDAAIDGFPEQLRPGDLLVLNDTRVIPARLRGVKPTGGQVEMLVERVLDASLALAHVRSSKPLRVGGMVRVGAAQLEMVERQGDLFVLRLRDGAEDFVTLLERVGEIPLPPYIQHRPDAGDVERYQTVYARRPGAVAAPTAGLHFDEALLRRIVDRGVTLGYVTLHVGAGTFQPVREDDVSRHHMHAERLEVSAALADEIARTRARGGRVVAVGTTVVRALESAVDGLGVVRPASGETRLFITPGFRFRVIDGLLTNFHLPQSTLLMLVCAFAGYTRVMSAYRHAVARRYRFFSYGDAMWLPRHLPD